MQIDFDPFSLLLWLSDDLHDWCFKNKQADICKKTMVEINIFGLKDWISKLNLR